MSFELLYWILMLIWVIFGLYMEYRAGAPYPRVPGHLLLFVLLLILGWRVFGTPVHP